MWPDGGIGLGKIIVTIGGESLTLLHTDFLVNMSASADILAQAKVEIDLSAIPLGKNVRRNQTDQSRFSND